MPMELTVESASAHADDFLKTIASYQDKKFEGRGIVTCGGGVKYGACAWVLVRLLRFLGCDLPIEVWALDDDEFDPELVRLLESYGATCVNAASVLKEHPHRRLRGWELKPYAILHSKFREVLFLDADNVPVRDPTYLLDSPQYKDSGTVFWPDPAHFRTPLNSPLWKIFGANPQESPDQESGQILLDKSRCWEALHLCNWYNQHSNFYYQHVYGDKETFRFAWQRLDQPISWPDKFASGELLFTLQQHDFGGDVLFQHRFYRKWSLYGHNTTIPGFEHEQLCLQFLDELRRQWKPEVHLLRRMTAEDRAFSESISGQRFIYDRLGHNRWPIRLGDGGRVLEGEGPNELFWGCEQGHLLFFGSDGRRRCRLTPASDGAWEGEQLKPRKMRLRLLPTE
ncbi:hypothetical protein [Lacipirellula sp.]|uniref:hypothetical protein n=1 Tax=Lacipirellula sp. TaxID=2691419 RepID=UPI003D0AF4DF